MAPDHFRQARILVSMCAAIVVSLPEREPRLTDSMRLLSSLDDIERILLKELCGVSSALDQSICEIVQRRLHIKQMRKQARLGH
jgi:hypothetical protein